MTKNPDHLETKDARRQVTLEEVKKMSDEELRATVAELHGWCHPVGLSDEWWTRGDYKITRNLPDYPHDLNAVHEVEKNLSEFLFADYCRLLSQITYTATGDVVSQFEFVHATARQRCEAIVLVCPRLTNVPRQQEGDKKKDLG